MNLHSLREWMTLWVFYAEIMYQGDHTMIVDLNITEYIRSLMKEEKNDLSHIE